MPWGGDIYMYADTTTLASAAVRYALQHVDVVAAGSALSVNYIHQRFGVATGRMHVGGTWALDRTRFHGASPADRVHTCARFGIDPNALIVMNVRRFFQHGESDLALEACMQFAREHALAHFVFLGGGGTEPFVAEARAAIAEAGFEHRFTCLTETSNQTIAPP